jgi:beta-carotene ketolase (CrtW type)
MAQATPQQVRQQTAIGLTLAVAIIGAWLITHIASVFWFDWSRPWAIPVAIAIVAWQCWLSVGLFIVAHDCMHGSLAPGHAAINRRVGQLCLAVYAGFDFDKLLAKHRLHHDAPGTGQDPDFDDHAPQAFWHWYWRFFSTYFSVRELIVISVVVTAYVWVLGASYANVLMFWAAPALLSSLQLFTFGTYLPHKPAALPFADRHRAYTNMFPEWLSLLTCFHFGYHHEHHLKPGLPWWKLPSAHRAYSAAQDLATRAT